MAPSLNSAFHEIIHEYYIMSFFYIKLIFFLLLYFI